MRNTTRGGPLAAEKVVRNEMKGQDESLPN